MERNELVVGGGKGDFGVDAECLEVGEVLVGFGDWQRRPINLLKIIHSDKLR